VVWYVAVHMILWGGIMLQKLSEIKVTPWDVLIVRVLQPIEGHHEFLFFVDAVKSKTGTEEIISIEGLTYWDYGRIMSRTLMAGVIVGVKLITCDRYIGGILLKLVSERNQFEDQLKSLKGRTG